MTQAEKIIYAAVYAQMYLEYVSQGRLDRTSAECAVERAGRAVLAFRGLDASLIDRPEGPMLTEFCDDDSPLMVVTSGAPTLKG